MDTHLNARRRTALASIVVTLVATWWQPGAYAQSTPSSAGQVGPHEPETPGLAVHTVQGLQHPGPKSSFRSGLTVKVTPVAIGSAGWEFKISFDSPRKIPADEPQATTVLLVDGKEFRATEWKGMATRPHRREGVLSFPDAGSSANVVEVRMQRAQESSPRVFRWKGPELK